MSNTLLHIPSLEEYAKIKKYNSDSNNIEALEMLACSECRYCRPGVNACVFGNQIRNLDYIECCPRLGRFL